MYAVNSVCWGPYDFGLVMACGSSDGAISILTFSGDGQWDIKKISNAHTVSLSDVEQLMRHYKPVIIKLRFGDPTGTSAHLLQNSI